jgi:hypothetical protein
VRFLLFSLYLALRASPRFRCRRGLGRAELARHRPFRRPRRPKNQPTPLLALPPKPFNHSGMQSGKEKATQLNFLERYGLKYLRRWNRRQSWAVRHLSLEEAGDIKRTERRAIAWACLAGIVSGTILGTTEMILWGRIIGELELSLWREQWRYWGLFLGIIVVVSAAEILFLYRNAVRATGRISSIAGLRVAEEDLGNIVPTGLARAALELPNPREPIYGIDPFARTPRWKLTLMAILYRLKVGATSFVFRIFLRRLLGRAALRFFIPLVAIPVYAAWNSLVTAWVLRQARIRSLGPAAVRDALEAALEDPERLSREARRTIVSGVGEIVIRTADAHPNFVLLLEALLREMKVSPADIEDNWRSGRKLLESLDGKERKTALSIFRAAAIIDGRLRKREMEFLEEAHRLCGFPFDPEAVRRLRDDFLDGRGIRGVTAHEVEIPGV